MTEKILVTGGFGLVGSQTVRRLAAEGHQVSPLTSVPTSSATRRWRTASRRGGPT
jgi:uncharacterized protein YbjT (DUF2867 family)